MDDTTSKGQESTLEAQSRRWLTFIVAVIGVLGVIGLGLTSLLIHSSDPKESLFERIKYVSATILPLLASWVGTILAFYFSKENLAAATQSVTDLTKTLSGLEKLKSLPVRSEMRPLSKITFEQIAPGADDTIPLATLLAKYSNIERIVVLDPGGVMRLLVYKSMIERFISQVATNRVTVSSGHGIDKLTLADLLAPAAGVKSFLETSFGFVSADATLADAKQVMDKIPKCRDVFVTISGNKTEPMIGWVTDNLINENATV